MYHHQLGLLVPLLPPPASSWSWEAVREEEEVWRSAERGSSHPSSAVKTSEQLLSEEARQRRAALGSLCYLWREEQNHPKSALSEVEEKGKGHRGRKPTYSIICGKGRTGGTARAREGRGGLAPVPPSSPQLHPSVRARAAKLGARSSRVQTAPS